MGIGGSIFLIAVGALLAFAVDYQLWWLDVNVAGWILMVVGVVGLVVTIMIWSRRRPRSTVVEREDYGNPPP